MIKKIAVLYLKSGSIQSIGHMEAMVHRLEDELKNEGKAIVKKYGSNKGHFTQFDDGSTIKVIPYGTALVGFRLTHVYIDGSAMGYPQTATYLNNAVLPFMIPKDSHRMEVDSDYRDRVFVYQQEQKQLRITKYFQA